jgi:hypothetical protein
MPEQTDDGNTAKGENVILSTYNQIPNIPYQFAYKRKKFHEVKMGFEFKTEDEARDCIERVSILYKRLKNSYKEESSNAANQSLGGSQAPQQSSVTESKQGKSMVNVEDTIESNPMESQVIGVQLSSGLQ